MKTYSPELGDVVDAKCLQDGGFPVRVVGLVTKVWTDGITLTANAGSKLERHFTLKSAEYSFRFLFREEPAQ